ncbi:MAG: hypothetical protein Q8W51_00010 [Candidatus Palauibacterales bacterium]|nr:hypothetical protein [Candidatus Palauibacterales bacterium]
MVTSDGIEPPRASSLRPELAGILVDPSQVTAYTLWLALPDAIRREAVEAVLSADDRLADLREDTLQRIASNFNFRRETLDGWDSRRVATYGSRLQPRKPPFLANLLYALHMEDRRPMMVRFLDELGVEHVDGRLEEADELDGVPAEAVARAADVLLEHFDAEEVVTYLLTLRLSDGHVPGLDAWLHQFGAPTDVQTEPSPPVEDREDESAASASPIAVESTDRFTTIDKLFVRAVADVSQRIEGALTHDQLEDAVEELIALNSSRHRSFFHAGFMDSELGQPPREQLPAQNPDRLRWYWAGYLTGLARREEDAEIVEFFDAVATVKHLGKGGRGPSYAAGRLVFEALCRSGRPGEAAAFVDAQAVQRNRVLFGSLQAEGIRLLHADRAPEARALYDLLGEVISELEKQGTDTSRGIFLDIRRRRAHCYRQLGEAGQARRLLERLREEESDPEVRAMVEADLGLIDCGFTRLSDLQIPPTRDRLDAFREALERGEEQFRLGAEADVRYSAHGRYALGVLALLREDYDTSARQLDTSLSVFESEPERYRHDNLLANARLYLGVSIALSLQTARMDRASQLIREGLQGDGDLPDFFLEDVLEAIEIKSPELARSVAESVLDAVGDGCLDVVSSVPAAAESSVITEALLSRARDGRRGETNQVADNRRVLPMLLAQDRLEEAAQVLDLLEAAAHGGVGVEEFLQVLSDPTLHEPAWDAQEAGDARVTCLEAAGDYDVAATVVEGQFHRTMSKREFGYRDAAEGLIDRIAAYGPTYASRAEELRGRLDAERDQDGVTSGDTDERAEAREVRILFVGGDERQVEDGRRVKTTLAETHPRIEVDFRHPGWGSNWNKELEWIQGALHRYDGLVIMRYIRTEFGRQLRKSLGSLPWYPCTTSGLKAMRTSIINAASLARRHLQSQQEQIRAGGGG